MAIKTIWVEGLGDIRVQKRKGTSSVRIHLRGSEVTVTMPYWVSQSQALKFIESKREWITTNLAPKVDFTDGTYIGKKHILRIIDSDSTQWRATISNGTITVSTPNKTDINTPQSQQKIAKYCEKALKSECEELIMPRINDLAFENGLEINTVSFKKLKSRWGSCDQQNNIIINIYLVQLPWQLIDYVLVHELCHTIHHNHSVDFWSSVAEIIPDYKQTRKKLKIHHPDIVVE